MPAKPHIAGPAELHVGTGGSGALQFLGWSREGVRVRGLPLYSDIRADVAGDQPFGVVRTGRTHQLSIDLSVWDDGVLEVLQAGGTSDEGLLRPGDIGGEMVADVLGFRLLVYPSLRDYRPSQADYRIRNYKCAYLMGPDVADPVGHKATTFRLMFRCIPVYDPATGVFTLYDGDATGKPVAV